MTRSRRTNNALVYALYLNAGLLAGILLVLLAGGERAPWSLPAAYAQHQPAIGGGAGIFVMPAQFSVNTWGAYLLDIDRQTLCAYQFLPGEKMLRLIAARHFRHDRDLKIYNTAPTYLEVQELVKKQEEAGRASVKPDSAQPPSPESPPKPD